MGITYFFWDPNKEVSVKAAWWFARAVKNRFGRNYRVWTPLQNIKDGSWSTWVDVCGDKVPDHKALADHALKFYRAKYAENHGSDEK